MIKQSKGSPALIVLSMISFVGGGAAWFLFAMVFTEYEHLAVLVAAILAGIGGLLLIINAVIHPGSVKIPDVQPPKIHISPNIGGYQSRRPQTASTATSAKPYGIININEWPIVNVFKKDGVPLTRRQQIRGTVCNLLWMAVLAVYLLGSFYTDRWEISWVIFIGGAVVHALLYGLLSIGQKNKSNYKTEV